MPRLRQCVAAVWPTVGPLERDVREKVFVGTEGGVLVLPPEPSREVWCRANVRQER